MKQLALAGFFGVVSAVFVPLLALLILAGFLWCAALAGLLSLVLPSPGV